MKLSTVASIAATLLSSTFVEADGGCQFIAGNNYCNAVNLVNYNNIGFKGSYNRVTSFNDDGSCSSESQSFSGNLAPLNEDISVHFRGPINLKQFAVYYKGGSNQQKREEQVSPQKRHAHHHHEKREPVFVTQFVHATKTVYGDDGQPTAVPTSQPAPSVDGAVSQAQGNVQANANLGNVGNALSGLNTILGGGQSSSTMATSAAAPSSSGSSSGGGSGDWKQSAYYKAGGKSDGCVFMNNEGGQGSGVWDTSFGNSISYAGSDGTSCASSPQALDDVTLGSNKEFMIFSDSKCSGNNGDCGYYRPGIPAHHGFSGDTKMFLFEFSMPHDKDGGNGFNQDMPAVWFLNAQIPRTVQYGPKECSCWSTGCGELDVFEILDSGNSRLTSHLHTGQGSSDGQTYGGGGTPDYFERPTDGTLRAAVVFDGSKSSVTITKVDGTDDFQESYSDSDISGWQSKVSLNKANVKIADAH